jgi:hypothetical protein
LGGGLQLKPCESSIETTFQPSEGRGERYGTGYGYGATAESQNDQRQGSEKTDLRAADERGWTSEDSILR